MTDALSWTRKGKEIGGLLVKTAVLRAMEHHFTVRLTCNDALHFAGWNTRTSRINEHAEKGVVYSRAASHAGYAENECFVCPSVRIV